MTPARQDRVAVHRGSVEDFLGRLEAAGRNAVHNASQRAEYTREVFAWATDDRNLYAAWQRLEAGRGQSPGTDDLRYSDVPHSMLWSVLRDFRDQLRSGEYRCRPLKQVEIPKPDGRVRTLELPTIFDRTAGRALLQAIQPHIDPTFDERSCGFRPGRDRTDALARAEAIATRENRWVWVTDDISNAFPSTPRNRLLDIARLRLRNEQLVELIGKLADNGRRIGIPQGQPLSPFLLNLYLDHSLDKPWRRSHAQIPLIRVADDLLLLCRSHTEATAARSGLQQLLTAAGFRLKGQESTAIRSLNLGEAASWMGLELRSEANQLRINLSAKAWQQLEQHLLDCHLEPAAPLQAIATVLGWINQQGPVFTADTVERDVQRIIDLGKDLSFEELPPANTLTREWERAYARWTSKRNRY